MEKKISLATFEQVAADNGYEVFTAEEVAAYYKDGLQKSMKNELTSDEKELFAADIAFLQKAVCVDENGKEVTRYFRPEQVNWEKTEDGVLLKGIAGVFADTPTNRKLNRVGEAFVPSPDFMKSLESEEIDEDIIKAMRTGRYADTPENRRLHRVGQSYAKREGKGTEETDKEKKRVGDTKAEIEKLDAKYGKVYTALGKRKQEALERGDKAEAKRMTDAIARMEKEHDAEYAKLKEKEGGEKGDEKLHAKADERKGGEKGDKKLHEEAEKKEGTYAKAKRILEEAPVGAVVSGGGYGPFKKEKAGVWINQATGRKFNGSLADHIGGFSDFTVKGQKSKDDGEKRKKEPNPGSKKNPLKIDSIQDIHKDAAYQKITIGGHEATIVNRGTYDEDTHKPIYYVEAGSQTHAYTGLDMLKEKIEEFVRVANGGKADSDDKKSEVTPSEASKSFFESKFKNLKWKKGGDEDYPSVVAHKKFRGVPIDIEIDEDGQGEIIIGDADEGIEFGALTSEKAAKELWDTILEELEYYED